MKFIKTGVALSLFALSFSGCSDDENGTSTGSLDVLIQAEDSITDGLEPGDGDENLIDGWTVTFDRYIAAIGHIELKKANDLDMVQEDDRIHVIDLTKIPEQGSSVSRFESLEATRWNFHYSIADTPDDAVKHTSVSDADFEKMKADKLAYWISGKATKDGETITFDFPVDLDVEYGPCEEGTQSGVAIAADGNKGVNMTIHGDHIFFNGFPKGDEGGVVRRAGWLKAADTNADGAVDMEELKANSNLATLFPMDHPDGKTGYSLSGSPLHLEDAWDYVKAQLMTQGHFQGEGECPVNGEKHQHGHDHDH